MATTTMQTVRVANLANMASYTPAETIELMSRVGARKGRQRPDKVFLSAVSSGCLVSFACGAVFLTTAAPWFEENAPGIVKMINGLFFPSAIVMILYVWTPGNPVRLSAEKGMILPLTLVGDFLGCQGENSSRAPTWWVSSPSCTLPAPWNLRFS